MLVASPLKLVTKRHEHVQVDTTALAALESLGNACLEVIPDSVNLLGPSQRASLAPGLPFQPARKNGLIMLHVHHLYGLLQLLGRPVCGCA